MIILALLFFSWFQKEEKKPDLTLQADLMKAGRVEDPLDAACIRELWGDAQELGKECLCCIRAYCLRHQD